jgi:hypothetical protein
MADKHKAAAEALHANFDLLWDAVALLDGALAHEDLREPTAGAQRIVRMAAEKLRELETILSPLI